MFDRNHGISLTDPELWNAIRLENQRQEAHIELIASENYASPAVMAAQGSQLTNKYAEGYPGKRYYGGCAGPRPWWWKFRRAMGPMWRRCSRSWNRLRA